MSFKVRIFPTNADYETLHVAKLTCFPLEMRDYKPYAQARICFAQDGLHLQLLSFEATPLPDSAVSAVLKLDQASPALIVTLYADGTLESVAADGIAVESSVHTFTGEDLQGVYWGGNIIIPSSVLHKQFGGLELRRDNTFAGNLYKLCKNPKRPHYGCFYPADFSKPLTDPQNFGSFVLIDY